MNPPPAARAYATCFSLALAFFIASTMVSDVIARTTIGSEGLVSAISRHAYYAVTQPFGTGILLAPFVLVAWMAASLARRKSLRHGLSFLCATCIVLTLMYFFAYQDSQHYMIRGMWTAATLAIGLLAFKSVPVLVVALVAFLILRRRRAAS
jgi:hypothetical protein